MAFIDDMSTYADGDSITTNSWTRLGSSGTATYSLTKDVIEGFDDTRWVCPDQGSADHLSIFRYPAPFSINASGPVVRAVDNDNYVEYIVVGSFGGGGRFRKQIAGTASNLITRQPVGGEWIKIEVEGTTYRLYAGGTGASPTWSQVSSDQTVTNAEISTAETSQGFTQGVTANDLWQYFEADALGAGGIPTLTAKITGITATSAVPVIDVEF